MTNDFFTMELYWLIHILVFLSIGFELSSTKWKKVVLIAWCIFFTFFGGLRWNTGNDWYQYLGYFRDARWGNILSYYREGFSLMEPGFMLLNTLVKSIFGRFYWQNLLMCGFQQFTFYHFCTMHSPKRPLLVYSLFLSAVCYFPVRAGFAVAICMWGYKFIKEKNLLCFVITILAASSIHSMCMIFLPMYWIGKIKPNLWIYSFAYFYIFASSIVFANYFEGIALSMMGDSSQLACYLTYGTEGGRTSIFNVFMHYGFLCVFVYVKNKQKLQDDDWTSTIINMYFISFAITMVFSEKFPDLNRLNDIFNAATVLSFVWALDFFLSKKGGAQKIAALFFVFYYCYKFRNGIGGAYFEYTCVPYRNIFDYNSWDLF